jgi:uncharacterized protein (TIGR02117 family)
LPRWASFRLAWRSLAAGTAGLALAACATTDPAPAGGPVVSSISVVERGWHTDICVRDQDADAWVLTLAHGFDGARYLCFGFGERQYVVERHHDVLTMLSALLPSQGALLMTALRDTPAAAFGPGDVVSLGVSRAGAAGLAAFLRRSTQTDGAGQPVRLADGPYPGSVFFGATGTYDLLYTCNTWTADGLRVAGLPISDGVLFSGGVMRQVRRVAATQGSVPP